MTPRLLAVLAAGVFMAGVGGRFEPPFDQPIGVSSCCAIPFWGTTPAATPIPKPHRHH